MARLELALLGEPAARVDGRPVDLGPRRNALLLAALALARGAAVPSARLAEIAWDGAPPGKWETSLYSRISRLRAALGTAGDRLVTRAPGYALLLDAGDLDVECFEGEAAQGRALLLSGDPAGAVDVLASSIARWRGRGPDILLGSDTLAVERSALEEQRATALEALIDACLAAGDDERALRAAEPHVREFPFREHAWAQVATALVRRGRQADALERLRDVRALLRDELGIDPGQELRELERAILDQDPRVLSAPERQQAAPNDAPRGVAPPAWLRDRGDSFVGRTAECAAIERVWSELRAGGGTRIVLVEGDAGIGKTRTAGQAVGALDGAPAVLGGRCDEDPLLTFQPFAEMLAPLFVETAALEQLGREIAGLALVVPDLPVRFEWIAAPDVTESDVARAIAVSAMERLRRHRFGAAPIVVVIDDAHWVTLPALRMLRHIVATQALAPAMIVLTARHHEARGELDDARLMWTRAHVLDVVRLGPLDDGASEALAVARGADAAVAASACGRAGGNPFYLEELVRHLGEAPDRNPDTLPDTVRATIGRRLERLPAETRRALAVGALAGPQFSGPLVARATGRSLAASYEALEPALAAGVINVTAQSGTFVFGHALVREMILARDPARHHLGHQALAVALADATTPSELGQRAFHASEAVVDAPSARVALVAARAAAEATVAAGAGDDALRVLEAALDRASVYLAPADPDVLETRIAQAHLTGQVGAADQALATLTEIGDLALAAAEYRQAGMAYYYAAVWTSIDRPELAARWQVIRAHVDDPDDDVRLLADLAVDHGSESLEATITRAYDVLDRVGRRARARSRPRHPLPGARFARELHRRPGVPRDAEHGGARRVAARSRHVRYRRSGDAAHDAAGGGRSRPRRGARARGRGSRPAAARPALPRGRGTTASDVRDPGGPLRGCRRARPGRDRDPTDAGDVRRLRRATVRGTQAGGPP